MLYAKEFVGADDDKLVVATVSSAGRVIELTIEDQAVQLPQQLGERIKLAVTQGRTRASKMVDCYRLQCFPDSSMDSLKVPQDPPLRVDYHLLEYAGPARVRNAIAESLEAIKAVSDKLATFQHTMLSEEIGQRQGSIEINLADTKMDVTFNSGKIQGMRGSAIANEVMASLGRARARAQSERKRQLRLTGSPY
ncbi:hypothetical protein ACTIVE_3383 [Actinomadura verrucosospora]|uniref:Uncharacterized protein n=2 Tax=Actinomadura verrucosospora TaxID=46165 RepID=A0A7D4A3L4_ACTVE|nr:hypothetical protein ACTIVE_3383 [Actinomadura verrucosospora]